MPARSSPPVARRDHVPLSPDAIASLPPAPPRHAMRAPPQRLGPARGVHTAVGRVRPWRLHAVGADCLFVRGAAEAAATAAVVAALSAPVPSSIALPSFPLLPLPSPQASVPGRPWSERQKARVRGCPAPLHSQQR